MKCKYARDLHFVLTAAIGLLPFYCLRHTCAVGAQRGFWCTPAEDPESIGGGNRLHSQRRTRGTGRLQTSAKRQSAYEQHS